jgi:hypothetical protein
VRVEVRCPYCEQMQGVECESLHAYDSIERCWYCEQTYVVSFAATITASPAGSMGNKKPALERVKERQRTAGAQRAQEGTDAGD